MTIYELSSDYIAILAMMEDPEVDEQTLADTLEGIEGALEDKADNYARVMRQMDANAKAIKAEEERLYNRRKSIENRSAWLKKTLQTVMEETGNTKFKTQFFSFGIQKNAPSVVIDAIDLDSIPADYLVQQAPKLDKMKALAEYFGVPIETLIGE